MSEFKYAPYDPAAAAQAAATYGTVRERAGGELVYYDPSGKPQATDSGIFRQYVIQLFRAMRAGVIPWVSERTRQSTYAAHHQAVPAVGYGLAGQESLYSLSPQQATILPILRGGHHAVRAALTPQAPA